MVTCPVEFLLAQFLSVSFVLVGVGVGFSLVLCLWKSLMLALLTDTEGGVSSLGGVGLQVASVLGG